MKIKLLLVGKTTELALEKLIEEYKNRLIHYINFEWTVIPELKNTRNMPPEMQKMKEGELILNILENRDEVILLDEKGKQYTSAGFAELLQKKMIYSNKNTVFVVGGAYGFSEAVYERADALLSLSSMTFSHQMVRLVFAEQLYRAMTIIKGEAYHHE